MRDLEIRGAGSILGARQHGHMENVGYDMYMKLLRQAIAEKQGEKIEEITADCLIDIRMNSFIPKSYIESEELRMEIYKLIASIDSEEMKSDVIDELIDRFGDIPKEVLGLIDVALYRKKAMNFGITEIKETAETVIFYLKEISMEKIEPLVKTLKNRLLLNAGARPYFQVKKADSDGLSTIIEALNAI
jgi:transcription-repair coupling factor (superfamily II helicase)